MSFLKSLPVCYIRAFLYVFALPLILTFTGVYLLKDFQILLYVISLVYIPISIFFVIYLYLAPKGICFLFAQENIATLIQSGGKLIKTVYSSMEYRIDENFEVSKLVNKKPKKHFWGGLTFYGITPFLEILFIELRYNKLIEKKKSDGGTELSIQRSIKTTSNIDLRVNNYNMEFINMETKDRTQIYADVAVTLRVTNIRTFFYNRDPYGRLEDILYAFFRSFVREYNTDQLIGDNSLEKEAAEKKSIEKEAESIFNKKLLGKMFLNFLADTGKKKKLTNEEISVKEDDGSIIISGLAFEIYNVSVLDIGLKDKTTEESTRLLYNAKKRKEAIIIEANAEKEKILTIAEAEAERINKIGKVCKENGISPETIMLIEKFSSNDPGANYMFWHGGFSEETRHKFSNEELAKITQAQELQKNKKP